MSVNSVSSNGPNTPQTVHTQPEASEVKKVDRDKDGDSDDVAAPKVAAPKPVVNTNGQPTGTIINITA